MTLIRDKNLQTGIAGSLAIHAVLLLLLAWGFGVNAYREWQRRIESAAKVEKEVTLLFPEQIIPPPPAPPPPPKPEMKSYIRTTQNKSEASAPANAKFASDRNTVAASRKGPSPDATLNMPSTDGIAPRTNELANRDFRDGQIKNDAVGKAPAVPQMLPPHPSSPPSILKPEPPRPKPEPPPPAPQVAKADTAAKPVLKMMEQADADAARLEVKTPPLKIRERAEAPDESPPAPAKPAEPSKVVKAIPVPNPIEKTAGVPEKDAFSPTTRTSTVRGTISNRGEDAVDAESTPMGVYMRGVTGAVEKKWHIYRMLKKDAVTFGSLRVRFYVKKNGRVEDLKIISDPRDADPRLADFTLRAIKDADIPPIPADLLPMLEGERVKIEYDVLIY